MSNLRSQLFSSWLTPLIAIVRAIPRYFRLSQLQGFFLVGAIGFSAALLLPLFSSPSFFSSPAVAQKPPVEVILVGYGVPKPAHDEILAAFQEKWKREKGQDVVLSRSYGASGSQARAVLDGLEADLVHLALESDVNALVKGGLVNPDWKQKANGGFVAKSTVAIATRPGNPKRIREFADLVKPGVKVVATNPKTSGIARWNFLALWGSVTQTGGTEEQARQLVTTFHKNNVVVLARDGREATDAFLRQGQGDVLLNWEHELVYAAQKEAVPFFTIIPQTNISADTPLAIVDKNVDKHGNREVVEALIRHFYAPESQREFAKLGYRVVDPNVAKEFERKLPRVSRLFTIDVFGGWDAVQSKFFASGGVYDQIQGS